MCCLERSRNGWWDASAQQIQSRDFRGDEFVILLEDDNDQSRALSVVERLLVDIAEPVAICGHPVRVSCSIGVAIFPKDGTDYDTLLTNADLAMYRAKQKGRDTYDLFEPLQRID